MPAVTTGPVGVGVFHKPDAGEQDHEGHANRKDRLTIRSAWFGSAIPGLHELMRSVCRYVPLLIGGGPAAQYGM
jgi:hypothetical protein